MDEALDDVGIDPDHTPVDRLPEHGAFMQERIPGSELAVLPGTTHMEATRNDTVLLPMLTRFFDRHGL